MSSVTVFTTQPQMMCMSITPFTAEGDVDENALRHHLRRIVEAGIGVYLGSPGSGEGHALSTAEVRRVYDIGVDECRGKIPVCANPRESRDVEGMLEVAREAVAAGVDAVQVYQIDGGHGFQPTPGELGAYFSEVISEIDHPVVLGCNPVAGYMAPVALLDSLCRQFPQIIALNMVEAHTGYVTACRDALPQYVKLFVGQTTAIQCFALGADGVLSAGANIVPKTSAALVRSYASGDFVGLRLAAERLQRFYTAFVHSMAGARWEKLALKILDLPGGNGVIRRPYLFPDAESEQEMRVQMELLGVREWEGLPTFTASASRQPR